ncbi:hypothetical protein CEXT_243751 [Caerostris extrusa]|uniref:Uncharacterized protein n=1 Tax=Caerostris extrusa TaxID=172846 RepID=A0AAV4NY90_CAEEX|nr:hypothetical protein CEXT_243751 [Caerostris extrusa]
MIRLTFGALLLTFAALANASGDWESHHSHEWKAQPIKYIIKGKSLSSSPSPTTYQSPSPQDHQHPQGSTSPQALPHPQGHPEFPQTLCSPQSTKEIPVPKPYPVHVPVHIPNHTLCPSISMCPFQCPSQSMFPIEVIKEKSVVIKRSGVPVYLEEKHYDHGWEEKAMDGTRNKPIIRTP